MRIWAPLALPLRTNERTLWAPLNWAALTKALIIRAKCSSYLRKQVTVVSIALPFVIMDLPSTYLREMHQKKEEILRWTENPWQWKVAQLKRRKFLSLDSQSISESLKIRNKVSSVFYVFASQAIWNIYFLEGLNTETGSKNWPICTQNIPKEA